MPEPESLGRLRERAQAKTFDWMQGRDLTAVVEILAQFWSELEEMKNSLHGSRSTGATGSDSVTVLAEATSSRDAI